jgi:rhodanese-related sulfurtransferase
MPLSLSVAEAGRLATHIARQIMEPWRRRSYQAGWLLAIMVGALPLARAETQPNIQSAVLGQTQATAEVSTEEVRRILADGSAVVLDARPFQEFATGHIPGALSVAAKPGVPMSLYVSDVVEVERLVSGNKDAAIVLYCNGPFCGKSSRLAAELVSAGFTHVRRYQLGAPVWRALGGVMQVEPAGVGYIRQGDRTARFYDARSAADFASGSLRGAVNLPKEEVKQAKDDGRLPMLDHNTRIIVFGSTASQAQAVAQAIAANAFHNVMFCAEPFCEEKIAQQ